MHNFVYQYHSCFGRSIGTPKGDDILYYKTKQVFEYLMEGSLSIDLKITNIITESDVKASLLAHATSCLTELCTRTNTKYLLTFSDNATVKLFKVPFPM